VSKALEGAQKKVEGFNFDMRKNVVQYDDVMNRHRRAIYAMRREVLNAKDISPRIKKLIEEEAEYLANHPESTSEIFESILTETFPLDDKALDKLFDAEATKFGSDLKKVAISKYQEQEKLFSTEAIRKIERDIFLQVLDNLWMQHLENMDHLREGIHWISVGQRDPLVEYRRQGQRLFEEMQDNLRHDIVRAIMYAQPVTEDSLQRPVETDLTLAARGSVDNASQIVTADLYQESDFNSAREEQVREARVKSQRKKSRKAERKRKSAAKKKRRK
jgi:preprotein translocase subunit SecA